MHVKKIKNTLQHILAHLRLVKMLPDDPDPQSVKEIKQVDALTEDVESILKYIGDEERLEN